MGEVYRAWDQRLERDVALKLLPSALAADPSRLERFSAKPGIFPLGVVLYEIRTGRHSTR